MTSEDVIHSFFVPAFRVKQDVVPGRYTTVWFEATKPGTYHLFCAEYCGAEHSRMLGSVFVLEPDEYQAWLEGGGGNLSPAESGETLFAQYACDTCHKGYQLLMPTYQGQISEDGVLHLIAYIKSLAGDEGAADEAP